jgi:hypothetical protein
MLEFGYHSREPMTSWDDHKELKELLPFLVSANVCRRLCLISRIMRRFMRHLSFCPQSLKSLLIARLQHL